MITLDPQSTTRDDPAAIARGAPLASPAAARHRFDPSRRVAGGASHNVTTALRSSKVRDERSRSRVCVQSQLKRFCAND